MNEAHASTNATLRAFMRRYQFPLLWLGHGMLPPVLWAQWQVTPPDADEPSEHVRYAAFRWWLAQPDLDEARLNHLVDLIALDPDPGMAYAAYHELAGHAHSSESHALRLQASIAHHASWQHFAKGEPDFYLRMWQDIRAKQAQRKVRAERLTRILADAHSAQPQLSADELQAAYAQDEPDLMLALIEHPLLPLEQLQALAEWRDRPQAKTVRNAAALAIAKRERVQAQSPASD